MAVWSTCEKRFCWDIRNKCWDLTFFFFRTLTHSCARLLTLFWTKYFVEFQQKIFVCAHVWLFVLYSDAAYARTMDYLAIVIAKFVYSIFIIKIAHAAVDYINRYNFGRYFQKCKHIKYRRFRSNLFNHTCNTIRYYWPNVFIVFGSRIVRFFIHLFDLEMWWNLLFFHLLFVYVIYNLKKKLKVSFEKIFIFFSVLKKEKKGWKIKEIILSFDGLNWTGCFFFLLLCN